LSQAEPAERRQDPVTPDESALPINHGIRAGIATSRRHGGVSLHSHEPETSGAGHCLDNPVGKDVHTIPDAVTKTEQTLAAQIDKIAKS
jgi:hypothetical protein